ncbi:MAG TPA: efflux RND transporter permease subunit, partial [Usitatibacter sp.]|nr:efflux RND transporter permease subunit [Usitatibacter sp.]
MNITEPFVRRPVATTLLSAGIALVGIVCFTLLPVSPLPQVDFPVISVSASLPGASPEVMAATVATPLERAMGRIAGVNELTSNSSLGSSRVTMQFELSRSIDAAGREVQAAINAARGTLPTSLPNNPTYRKINPADAPVMIVALTSNRFNRGQLYDMASTNLAQRISQMKGVGQVTVGGGSLPSVRVELNPQRMNTLGIAFDDVRTAITSTNANRPKGFLDDGQQIWTVQANDQAKTAEEYKPIVVTWRNGAPVRLSDLGDIEDGVQDVRNYGMYNGTPAVLMIIFRQPNANIIEVVDSIVALMPELQATIPAGIDISVAMERTSTIRASLRDVERTLMVSVGLVILVVYLFLRSGRATLIPAVAIPISLIGTFAAMYVMGFSLNNLSLMALIVATGFVVDDAIVVLENVSRHIEEGMKPFEAALQGAREVSFTVVSMSVSLVAVFIPILFMGGIIGRLFREFAVTLSVSIVISLVVSLSTTPMMCSRLLKRASEQKQGRIARWSEKAFDSMHRGYERSLGWALRFPLFMVLVFFATVALTIFMYIHIPKGFFPQQDTGRPADRSVEPVHATRRRPAGAAHVGAEARGGVARPARAHRRHLRPAGQGPADLARDRPADGRAHGDHAAHHRFHAEPRLRPGAGLDHLPGPQPVPRRDGSRAAVVAEPADAGPDLRDLALARKGASLGDLALRDDAGAALREPPVAVRRGDALVQSRRGRLDVAGLGRRPGNDA